MTTPLTKLIAENKERPIAEAPRDGSKVIVTDGFAETWVAFWSDKRQKFCGHICGDDYYSVDFYQNELTHFRPLPDDRLARCFEILLNAAISAKEQNHIYEAAADIEVALQQITAIAEGKNEAHN